MPNLRFPYCCGLCPHREATTAACGHDHRQWLVRHFSRGGAVCPVYEKWETDQLSALAAALSSDRR